MLLLSVDEPFFEEGCEYALRVYQCALRSYLQPYKCLLSQFNFNFRFITTYPAIWLLTGYPGNGIQHLGIQYHSTLENHIVSSKGDLPRIPFTADCNRPGQVARIT